jgi:hypothetical protein
MADWNALAPDPSNALARRNTPTDYDPEQLMKLYQMGLLRGADIDMLMARMQPDKDALVRQAQITAMANGITAPGINQGQANVGMNIPIGANSTLAPSLMAKYTRADDGKPQMAFTPQMALELQNARANISSKGYGGEIDFGPLMVNYQRGSDKGPTANTYGVSVPFSDDATLSGNIMQGKGMRRNYQANVTMPDVFGGSFGITADMTPAEKAYALYANYRKQF